MSFMHHRHFLASRPTSPPPSRRRPAAARRDDIDDRYKWNLADIFPDWEEWEASYQAARRRASTQYAALKGTLAQGPDRLLAAFQLSEELGQLAYRVWYFPSLRYDEDQRDNTRQRAAPAGADPLRANGSRRSPGSAPSCCRFRSTTVRAAGWTTIRRWRSTASRSRISTASRSTCSTRRASG